VIFFFVVHGWFFTVVEGTGEGAEGTPAVAPCVVPVPLNMLNWEGGTDTALSSGSKTKGLPSTPVSAGGAACGAGGAACGAGGAACGAGGAAFGAGGAAAMAGVGFGPKLKSAGLEDSCC